MGKLLYICDDEEDLSDVIAFNLEEEGFQTTVVRTGAELFAALEERVPDALVLDLMLPDTSGLEICQTLRADPRFARLPILMLTAKARVEDRVVGFEVGADDYLTKPFHMVELILRIRALLRRAEGDAPPSAQGPLVIDKESRIVLVEDAPLELTPLEYQLLTALFDAGGRAMTRPEIVDATWGRGHFVSRNAVDTLVKRLRAKLGPHAEWLETVRGVGYRLKPRSPEP